MISNDSSHITHSSTSNSSVSTSTSTSSAPTSTAAGAAGGPESLRRSPSVSTIASKASTRTKRRTAPPASWRGHSNTGSSSSSKSHPITSSTTSSPVRNKGKSPSTAAISGRQGTTTSSSSSTGSMAFPAPTPELSLVFAEPEFRSSSEVDDRRGKGVGKGKGRERENAEEILRRRNVSVTNRAGDGCEKCANCGSAKTTSTSTLNMPPAATSSSEQRSSPSSHATNATVIPPEITIDPGTPQAVEARQESFNPTLSPIPQSAISPFSPNPPESTTPTPEIPQPQAQAHDPLPPSTFTPTPTPTPITPTPSAPKALTQPKSTAQPIRRSSWFTRATISSSPSSPSPLGSSHTSLSIDDEVPPPLPMTSFPVMPPPIVVSVDSDHAESNPIRAALEDSLDPLKPSGSGDSSSGQSEVDEDLNATITLLSPSPSGTSTTSGSTPANPPQRARVPSLSTLNPSTSRFRLSIPLLGRPKIPLDMVVKDNLPSAEPPVPKKEQEQTLRSVKSCIEISQTEPEPTNPTSSPSKAAESTTQIQESSLSPPPADKSGIRRNTISGGMDDIPSPSSPLPASNASDSSAPSGVEPEGASSAATPDAAAANAGSWWAYVPWSGSSPAPPSNSGTAEGEKGSAPPVAPSESQSQGVEGAANPVNASPSDATAPADPVPQSQAAPSPDPTVAATEPAPAQGSAQPEEASQASQPPEARDDKQPNDDVRSVLSTGTNATAATSWLSPWAWYASQSQPQVSSTTAAPSTTGTEGGEPGSSNDGAGAGTVNDEANGSKKLTESEMVKRDALAADEAREKERIAQTNSNPTPPHATAAESDRPASAPPTTSQPVPSTPNAFVESAQDRADSDVKSTTGASGTGAELSSNPIASSIQANPSGWASFLTSSSRILGIKSVKSAEDDEREKKRLEAEKPGAGGGEMEVMDLDEDETSTQVIEVKVGSGSADDKGSGEGKGEGEGEERGRTATKAGAPLTTDEDVKKRTVDSEAKRESSSTREETGTKTGASSTSRGFSMLGLVGGGSPSSTPPPSIAPAPANTGTDGKQQPSSQPQSSSQPKTASSAASIKSSSSTKSKSPAPSTKNKPPPPPNLVLPTWDDTFHTRPRSTVPPSMIRAAAAANAEAASAGSGSGRLSRTVRFVKAALFSAQTQQAQNQALSQPHASDAEAQFDRSHSEPGTQEKFPIHPSFVRRPTRERELLYAEFGRELPRSWDVMRKFGLDHDSTISAPGPGVEMHPVPPPLGSPGRRRRAGSRASTIMSSSGPGSGASAGVAPSSSAASGSSGWSEIVSEEVLRGCEKVVVIGVHGWFPGTVMRTVIGEPTGTSSKFVNMMVEALDAFQEAHHVSFKKVTKIPLEGEGTINRRLDKLYKNLLENKEWMDDIHEADVIFVAAHSQGTIVSTHILDRLVRDGHLHTIPTPSSHPTHPPTPSSIQAPTKHQADLAAAASTSGPGINVILNPSSDGAADSAVGQIAQVASTARRKVQRVCCLALCGIHLGPLRYLNTSSVLQPYFQYFESTAARELFEFQNTENEVSKEYVKALQNVLDHRIKMVYVASLDDQVVPIYSGLFTAASHPLILRALYIDGDAYHSSDFLSNLLVLLLRVLNTGLSDSGLITHLSEATAGSLNGVGHSTAYEELATYRLAVDYLFLANEGLDGHPPLTVEPFNAMVEQNDYEIPWSLRDLIADERVIHFFAEEIMSLRNAFREWHPKTTILRDVKRKLQPIQRLPSTSSGAAPSTSTVAPPPAGSSKL